MHLYIKLAICMMTSFYYYDQNPSWFCFLVLIRAFVIQTSLGLQNLNMKGKTKRILIVVVKINDANVQMAYLAFCLALLTDKLSQPSKLRRYLELVS